MNPKLSLEIGADIKGMEAALKRADQLLKQHEGNYKRVQTAIGNNAQKSRQLESSIASLSNEYKKGNISQAHFSKETDRLSAELREVNQSTGNYQKELRRLDREMDRVAASTSNYANNARRVNSASGQAAVGIGKMGKTTQANAVPALTSLGQVMQDAPYGIQGVANNITQLTTQLGYLSKSSGGAKGAVKALIGSLAGPAGILIAISAVTSAMVALSSSGVRFSDVLNIITGNSNKAAKAQRELAESYREAEGGVMAEMTVLKSLVSVAQDESRTRKERQRAIDAVNDKFPELHENLRLETINSEKAKIAIDKLTDSLLRQAKIEGVKGLIADTYAEMAEIAQKSAIDSASWWDILEAAMLPVIDKGTSLAVQGMEKQGEAIDKVREKLKNYEGTLKGLLGEDIKAEGVYTDVKGKDLKGVEPIRVPITPIMQSPDEALLKEWASNELKALENLLDTLPKLSEEYKAVALQRDMLRSSLSGGTGLESLNESAKAATDELAKTWVPYAESLENAAAVTDDITKKMTAAVSNMISNMMFDLIEGKKGFEDFAKSVLKSLIGLGIQSFMGGIGGGVFKILGFSGGGIAEPKGFASGGIIGGGSFSGDKLWARVNSGEMILNKDQQKNLYSQLQAPAMVNSVATEPLEIVGTSVVNGDQIQTVWSRAQNKRGRAS